MALFIILPFSVLGVVIIAVLGSYLLREDGKLHKLLRKCSAALGVRLFDGDDSYGEYKGGRGRELKSRVCTHEKGLVSQPTKERPPRFGGRYGARRSDKWKENARADENWSGVVAAGEADAVETGTSVAHASNKWAAAIAKVHSRMDGDGAEQGWVRR